MRSILAVVSTLAIFFGTPCAGSLLDTNLFKNFIDHVTNTVLGASEVQKHFNSLKYSNLPVDGNSLAVEVSASLSSKIKGPIQALEKLKAAIEEDVGRQSNPFVECCKATGTVYDERFKNTINTDEACITISENSPSSIRYPTTRIMEVMKENYRENPELKWQYLGTEDGILLNYPSYKLTDCRDYDPRFRPFYVNSATPVEKDLVVVIDTSGSMGSLVGGTTSLMSIAQQAAISVIQTLNPNDRFSVVTFSSSAKVLGSAQRPCTRDYILSEATPININFFESEIKKLTPSGATNYEAAIDTAFRFFENSIKNYSGEIRGKAVLFLTDGKKTEGGDPYESISQRNGKLNNEVVILTYGLGATLVEEALTMLTKMAEQDESDPNNGEIQVGIFEHIKDPFKLRSAMASYYNFFSRDNTQDHPSFTVPYVDLFGLGLLTSLCLPVHTSNNELLGVVCSDLTMSNLLSDITYFRQGENSYSFLIDGRGRTLMHPLMPLPSEASDDPLFVDIRHLERSEDAIEIFESMMSGQSGSKTFTSTRTLSRGSVLYDGIYTKGVTSSYHWRPVPDSNFSLCIVAGVDDQQATISPLQPEPNGFLYHRRDLLSDGDANCVHFNRFATKDESVVMISPGGFIDPRLYLETNETQQHVRKYTDFFNGNSNTNPGFKPSVINSVTASYKAGEYWKNNEASGRSVIWRYLGTTDGVMRLFPAVQLPKNYDHTRRPWFERSTTNKNKVVLSAPYLDQWGSGFLISLSTTITEPSASRTAIAVMGTDTTIHYMYAKLVSIPAYSHCRDNEYHCFLIDDSGFVIVHKDFIEPNTANNYQIENVHITFKAPSIADDLISTNNMIKTHCVDFRNIKEQFSYRVSTPKSGLDRLSSYARYEILPVSGTNVFIVIQRNLYIPPQSICCQTYGKSPDATPCTSFNNCGCLCYTQADFNYCTNKFNLLGDAGPTCTPRTPTLETKSIKEGTKIKGLPLCYDTECQLLSTQTACHGLMGCRWCVKDKKFNNLKTPYCSRQQLCPLGIQDACQPGECNGNNKDGNKDGDEEKSKSSNLGGIIGGVIGGLAGLIVVIVIACITCKRKRPQPNDPYDNIGHAARNAAQRPSATNAAFDASFLSVTSPPNSQTPMSHTNTKQILDPGHPQQIAPPPTYYESENQYINPVHRI